ncbi:ComF family protein [Amycolatopsis sp. NBC_00345]|uniref:ComF family protein n=1 Tax=Amycolatopsis sp. NBC_00345 TaxID=2975955 RepID=UPI002E25C315
MVLDLLVPARCAGCGVRGAPCCVVCSQVWGSLTEVIRTLLAGLAPVYALARHRGAARRMLIAYKERGRRDLAPFLGQAIAAALPALPGGGLSPARGSPALAASTLPFAPALPFAPTPLCLVPAPSRRSASRVRGGPHMLRIAEAAARQMAAVGAEVFVAPALELKGARDAVGLGRAERVANLAGRLRFVPDGRPPPGCRVVVLDDIVTTGATAAACVAALKSSGVAVAAVLTLLAAG